MLTASNCGDYKGAAFGLCSAYCETMQCGSATPTGSPELCNRLNSNFERITGSKPHCGDRLTIHSVDFVSCQINGSSIGDFEGAVMVNGNPSGYWAKVVIQDRAAPGEVNPIDPDIYRVWIFDEFDNAVYFHASFVTEGDVSVVY